MSSDPTPNVISLLASQDGPTPWPLPDGRVIDPCGLAAALASLSPRQVKALGLTISGISGRPGSTSSASAALQSSLASRLPARLTGSTLFKLTWRERATPFGASDLCAAGVGAPHLRQRLYFVADAGRERRHWFDTLLHGPESGRLAEDRIEATWRGETCWLGHADHAGPQGHGRPVGQHDAAGREGAQRHGATAGFWRDADWLRCSDGKARAVEPGTFPLADGVSGRVGRLRAYGNAIVPQVAAAFVSAYLDTAIPLEAAA